MSNHFSAANLKFPGDDARLDLTDLFVFAAPDNPDRTVLIMDSNPFTQGNGFHAVPCFPTISEVWLRLLEAYRG